MSTLATNFDLPVLGFSDELDALLKGEMKAPESHEVFLLLSVQSVTSSADGVRPAEDVPSGHDVPDQGTGCCTRQTRRCA